MYIMVATDLKTARQYNIVGDLENQFYDLETDFPNLYITDLQTPITDRTFYTIDELREELLK